MQRVVLTADLPVLAFAVTPGAFADPGLSVGCSLIVPALSGQNADQPKSNASHYSAQNILVNLQLELSQFIYLSASGWLSH